MANKDTKGSAAMGAVPFMNWGQEQSQAALALQNELLASYEEASRAWLTRMQSQFSLWSGLAATPDLPPRLDNADGMPSDLEYAAMRLFGDWSDENTAKLAAGNAVMGVFTLPGGGTTFTVGCTDWARGLDPEPDSNIARITGNVLDRLGPVDRS